MMHYVFFTNKNMEISQMFVAFCNDYESTFCIDDNLEIEKVNVFIDRFMVKTCCGYTRDNCQNRKMQGTFDILSNETLESTLTDGLQHDLLRKFMPIERIGSHKLHRTVENHPNDRIISKEFNVPIEYREQVFQLEYQKILYHALEKDIIDTHNMYRWITAFVKFNNERTLFTYGYKLVVNTNK